MTNAELAILSLIAEAPRHGYEIEQTIEVRGMRAWTEIGFSSIYYLLKKLEKAGMVESELIPTQGRGKARRIFQITSDGRVALKEATLEALTHPKNSFPPILLGIANLPVVSQEQALGALRSYRDGLAEKLEVVAMRAKSQSPLPDHVDILFDYSLAMIKAEKNWIETTIQRIKRED